MTPTILASSPMVAPKRVLVSVLCQLLVWYGLNLRSEAAQRRPASEGELHQWIENMVLYHGYTPAEVREATGLEDAELKAAIERLQLPATPPAVTPGSPLRVLPYPGGRHPRLGFFDGAVDPQRETKLSVFTPWDPRSYVVVDVPEAIFTQLGLTHLAHTHIPTIWDKQGVRLPTQEWQRHPDGSYEMARTLPNGVGFGVWAMPRVDHLAMRWWLRNGTTNPLSRVRAQVCVLLGRAAGFNTQTGNNKLLEPPFAACRDEPARRWVITAWDPLDRAWQNPPVPCIHSDPRLADIEPGKVRSARGWLWFYEGTDIGAEFVRLRKEYIERPDSGPAAAAGAVRKPVPDKLVVLTFDDSVASQYRVVRPLLKKYGFGATFFITEGFGFKTNKSEYLTWEQIAELHRDGFEIGNHTQSHMGVSGDTLGRLRGEVEFINEQCRAHGIPRPVSFAYPGNAIHPGALPILKELGIRLARRGAQPEFPYETGRGVAYEPGRDHPLLVPTAGDARPGWTLDDLRRAVTLARDGRIAVLQFHGVPDREHPWVNTPPERFAEYLVWLKSNGYRCLALRDVERYVDPRVLPAQPWDVIEWRRTQPAAGQRAGP